MIRNPLTIIAIFAGIAEISGTVVMPFLSETNQAYFIWFVMLFPTLLVSLFFWTLHKNHRVLYGPGDYKDERNFMPTQDQYGTPLVESQNVRAEPALQSTPTVAK